MNRSNAMLASRVARSLAGAAVLIITLVSGVAPTMAQSQTHIQRVVSPSGIEAWLVEDHTLPIIALQFAFESGTVQDPEGKEGAMNLMTRSLDEGAGDLDSQAFQNELEARAIQITFEVARETLYGELRTLVDEKAKAFELLALSLNSPRFDTDAVERMKAQTLASLRREANDPETQAFDLFLETAYPGHAYARRTKGTEATLAGLTPEDLRGLHRRVLGRDNLRIAVVGAIDAAALAPVLDQIFAAIPEKADLVTIPDVEPVTGQRADLTEDVPQTAIRFGGVGLKTDDPDFITATVVNHIFGGGSFTSRLFLEVREKRGLAYSVYSFLLPFDHSGALLGGVATRAERSGEALEVIEAEARRMAEEGPTLEELDAAKRYLIGSYPLRFDTSTKIARQLVRIQLEGYGIDYIDRRNGLIEAVTLEDAKRVAARLFGAPFTVSVVGREQQAEAAQ